MSDFNPNLTQRLAAKARRRVVKDWRSRLRDFSTIALALGSALQGAWLIFPSDLKATWPPAVTQGVGYGLAAVLLWGLVGKFVVQGPPADPPPPKE